VVTDTCVAISQHPIAGAIKWPKSVDMFSYSASRIRCQLFHTIREELHTGTAHQLELHSFHIKQPSGSGKKMKEV